MQKINSDRVFQWVVNIILLLFLIVTVYPLWFVLIASVSEPVAVNLGQVVLWPKNFTLDAYRNLLEERSLLTGYKNTILYTMVGTCVNILVLLPGAFAMSRKELRFRKFFSMYFLITMYFSGGVIPTFIQVRSLGLMNSMWALILPGAFSVYNMLICRQFFITSISDELYDSARMDGSGYTRFFLSIVLPLSKAIIAVMVLFHALNHWNAYLSAMYYLSDSRKFPLQLVLKNMQDSLDALLASENPSAKVLAQVSDMVAGIKYSIIPASSIPVALLYPFAQKYFVKGVMIGSVKG